MKDISKSYLSKKINKLNKKIHRAENQNDENKIWWRKMKLEKLKHKMFIIKGLKNGSLSIYFSANRNFNCNFLCNFLQRSTSNC